MDPVIDSGGGGGDATVPQTSAVEDPNSPEYAAAQNAAPSPAPPTWQDPGTLAPVEDTFNPPEGDPFAPLPGMGAPQFGDKGYSPSLYGIPPDELVQGPNGETMGRWGDNVMPYYGPPPPSDYFGPPDPNEIRNAQRLQQALAKFQPAYRTSAVEDPNSPEYAAAHPGTYTWEQARADSAARGQKANMPAGWNFYPEVAPTYGDIPEFANAIRDNMPHIPADVLANHPQLAQAIHDAIAAALRAPVTPHDYEQWVVGRMNSLDAYKTDTNDAVTQAIRKVKEAAGAPLGAVVSGIQSVGESGLGLAGLTMQALVAQEPTVRDFQNNPIGSTVSQIIRNAAGLHPGESYKSLVWAAQRRQELLNGAGNPTDPISLARIDGQVAGEVWRGIGTGGKPSADTGLVEGQIGPVGTKGIAEFLNPAWLALGPVGKGAGFLARIAPGGERIAPLIESYIANAGLPGADHVIGAAFRAGFDRAKVGEGALRDFFNNNHFAQDERGGSFNADAVAGKIQGGIDVARADAKALGPYWDYHMGRPGATTVRDQSLTARGNHYGFSTRPGEGQLAHDDRIASEYGYTHQGRFILDSQGNRVFEGRTAAETEAEMHKIATTGYTTAETPPTPRFLSEDAGSGRLDLGMGPADHNPGVVSQVTDTTRGITDPSKTYTSNYKLVEADDLILSHTPSGVPNPAYPEGVQPRARERVASQAQVDNIAANLEPDLLLGGGALDRGTPIVAPDSNVVLSGNGRGGALMRAMTNYTPKYDAYRAALELKAKELGFPESAVSSMQRPILVRQLQGQHSDIAQFAGEANYRTSLAMSPAETAMNDAGKLNDGILRSLRIGENQTIDQALLSSENDHVRSAILQAIPETERASLADAEGRLNRDGLQRIKAAIFAKTFPGEAGQAILQRFSESLDPGMKNIEAAIFRSLPQMAKSEAMVRSGERAREFGIGEDLAAAVTQLSRLKQTEGAHIPTEIAQMRSPSLFAGTAQLGDEQARLLEILHTLENKPRQLTDFLNSYSRGVERSSQMLMTGGNDTKASLMEQAFAAAAPNAPAQQSLGDLGRPSLGVENKAAAPDQNGSFLIGDKVNLKSPGGRKTEPGTISEIIAPKSAMEPGRIVVTYDKGGSYVLPDTPANRTRLTKITGEAPQQELASVPAAPAGPREVLAGPDQRRSELVGPDPDNPAYAVVKPLDGAQAGTEQRVHYSYLSEPARSEFADRLKALAPAQKPWEVSGERTHGWMDHVAPATGSEDDLVRELGVGRPELVGHDTAAMERVVALERGIDQLRLAKADARGLEVHGGADGWYYVTKKGEMPNYERKNANYAGPVLDKGQAIDYAAYGDFKPGPDLEGFGFRPFEGRAVPGTPLAEDVRKTAIASRQAEQVARTNLETSLKTDAERAIFRATTGTEGDFASWQHGKANGMTDDEIKARLANLGQGGGTLEKVPGGYGYNKGTVFVGGSSKGPGVVAISGNKLVSEVRRIYQIPTPDEVAKATGGPGAPPSAGVTTPPPSTQTTPGGKGQGGAPSVDVHGGYEIRQAPKGGWVGVVPGDVNKNAPFRAKSREELIADIDAKAARTAARDAAQAKQIPKLERPAQTFTLPSGEKGTVTGAVTPDQTVEATMANGGVRRVPAKYAEAPKVTFATGMRQATQAKSFDLAAVNFVDAWKNAKSPDEMTTAADALARHYGFETLGEAQRALRPAKLAASEQERLAFLLRDVPQEVRTVWRNSAKVATVTPPPSAKKGAEPVPTPQEIADVFGDVGVQHRAALDQIPRDTVDQVRRFLRTPEGKQLTPEMAAQTPELAGILSHALETVKAEATPDAVQEVARLLIEREKQRNQFIAKKAASRAPDGPPAAAPSWRPEQDPGGRWFLRNDLTGELDKSISLSSEVGAKAVADKRNAISAPLTDVGASGPIPLFGRPVFGDVPTEPTAAAIAEKALSDVQAATEAHARGEITTAELQGIIDGAAEKYRINKALEAVPKQDFEAIAQRAEAQVKQAEDSIAARQRISQTADPQATAQLKILRDKAERARKMADEAAQTPPGPPPSAAGGGGEGEPPRPPAPPAAEPPPPEGYSSWDEKYAASQARHEAAISPDRQPPPPLSPKEQQDAARTQRRQAELEKNQANAAEARARELEQEFRKQGLTTKADIKWAEANAWRNIARLKAEGLPHDLTDELFVAAHRMNYDDLKVLVQDYNKLSARLARGAGSSFDTAISILNLRKAIMASLDLSWGLRQGVMVSLNPFYAKTTAGGFKAGAHALLSGNYAEDLMASIESHPLYDVITKKMGVDLTEWRNPAPLTKFEEEAQSHLAQYVPGINQSNRAFVAQANKVRMDLATNWIMSAERGGRTLTDTQYRNMGLWINSITGRGELGKFLSSSAPLLNALLFAPRFMASRIEAPLLPLYFAARGDPRMALLATRDLALWFGTSVAILKLTEMAGAKVEWDPRSNDFMKITDPRTGITVDPMGGYTQLPRLMWQVWNGERADRNGHIVALDGKGTHGTPWEQVGKYFLGKGSPNLNSAYHLAIALGAAHGMGGIISGDHPKPATDIFNQDVTLENELNDLLPLGQSDLINAIQADRNNGGTGLAGAAEGALSLFGAGVQVQTKDYTPVGIGSGLAGLENFAETQFRRGRLPAPTAPSGAGGRPVPQATGRPAGFR